MFDYKDFDIPQSNDLMDQLTQAALLQSQIEKEVAELKELLLVKEQELRVISQQVIPGLMDCAGISEATTKDGIKIVVSEDIRANIPKEKSTEAFRWLDDHHYGNLIKHEFKISFNRDEEELAASFERQIQENGNRVNYSLKRCVHPSTLTSFVKSLASEGLDVPSDLFGVFRQRASKIRIK